MKRIALLCLIAFAHGCCCPSWSSHDTINELTSDAKQVPILFPLYNNPPVTNPDVDDLKKLVFKPSTRQIKETIPLINDQNTFTKGTQAQYSDRFFVGMIPQSIFEEPYLPVLVEKTGSNQYKLIGSDPVEHVKDLETEANYQLFCKTLSQKVNDYIHTHDPYPRIKIGAGSRLQVRIYQTLVQKSPCSTHFVALKDHGAFFIPFEQVIDLMEDLKNLLFNEHNRPRDPKKIKSITIDQAITWHKQGDNEIAPGVMFVYENGNQPFAVPIVVELKKTEEGCFDISINDYVIPRIAIPMLSRVVFSGSDLAAHEDD